ncbi:hypothetical protein OG429_03195 [Streptomyces sp. NBC_00190]|uniref:hypothetical protein n=1 Tax=unclassified Streptomyces TaxID=2593676 RepID=UPI002E2B8306|nr:hypothetical protein [Streptomyces sp. NBC_00190]WSZ38409.1 hypothetical protein OG239_06205 [Streptomyces sp. NBC_00868]
MDRRSPEKTEEPTARDYSGAVYGSLLAASVIATAGAAGPFPRLQLMVMLLTTGLVFWITHVYVRIVGDRLAHEALSWEKIRSDARREWPIIGAALPPIAAVMVCSVLGLGLEATGWVALGVALAGQVVWATAGLVSFGAPRRMIAVTCAVNLLLGLVIVAAKVLVKH